MLFFLSKLIGFLISPLILLIIALALVWLFAGRARSMLYAILALLLIFYSPLGPVLILPLEERFEGPVLPDRVDGIIALGGAIDSGVSGGRKLVELETGADRIVALVRLAKRYPDAKVVYSGGGFGFLEEPVLDACLFYTSPSPRD